MNLSALEVVRRVETALERATRDQARLAWRVDYAELLLWVKVKPNGTSGSVVTRRPGGGLIQRGEMQSVLSLLPPPFCGSKLVRDHFASKTLTAALETMLHTVNALARSDGGFAPSKAELCLDLVIESSGELRIAYRTGVSSPGTMHEITVSFSSDATRR